MTNKKTIILIQINNYCKIDNHDKVIINNLISQANLAYNKIKLRSDDENFNHTDELLNICAIFIEMRRICISLYCSNKEEYRKIFNSMVVSIITLLSEIKCEEGLKKKYLDLGWDVVEYLYGNDYCKLHNNVLFYFWLKKYNLVTFDNNHFLFDDLCASGEKDPIEPSDVEIEEFYEKNRHQIYRLIFNMDPGNRIDNPLDDKEKRDFYTFHKKLSSLSIPAPETTL